MNAVSVRPATIDDAAFIARLYNHYIQHSTCLWRETLTTIDERSGWIITRDPRHAVVIAERNGVPIGYGAVGPFRPFPGYRDTAEHAVYVDPAHHRQGVGRLLVTTLCHSAAQYGLHALIGAISADQPASLALHAALGFREVGRLPGVGVKFGRRLDLVLMQIDLARCARP